MLLLATLFFLLGGLSLFDKPGGQPEIFKVTVSFFLAILFLCMGIWFLLSTHWQRPSMPLGSDAPRWIT